MSWVFSQAGAGWQIERREEKRANAYGDKKNVEHAEILFGGGGSSKLYQSRMFTTPRMLGLPLKGKRRAEGRADAAGFDTFSI
jgi:hypothetical protein